MVGIGVYTLWTAGTGVVPLTAGALTLLAQEAACGESFIGPATGQERIDGCKTINDGYGNLNVKYDGIDWILTTVSNCPRLCAIKEIDEEPSKFNGAWGYYGRFSCWDDGDNPPCSDSLRTFVALGITEERARTATFKLVPVTGTCGEAVAPGPLVPEIPDYVYEDEETGCTLNYKFEGMVEYSQGGEVGPVFLVSGGDVEGVRSGNKVGGCNVYNYIAYKRDKLGPEVPIYGDPGGPGGPGAPPFPPSNDSDEPFWLRAIKDALGLFIIQQLLELFNLSGNQGALVPAAEYQLIAPCDKTESGEPQRITAILPEEPIFDRILSMQAEQLAFLQQHLNWKTPVCADEQPEPEGDFRTISFRSTEISPYGKSRLRKRLRYRSIAGVGLDALIDHWKDFQWEAGPFRVRHVGSSWGAPEVWAASEDEGKRVLRHAAGEAGIDPDQVGRWSTRRSNSSRRGVSGTMNVDTTGGYYWVTERDGSSHRPLVALTSE
jgi:hypothetical protein